MAIDRGYNEQSRVYMDIRTGGNLSGGSAGISARPSSRVPARSPAGHNQSSRTRRRRGASQKGMRQNISRKPSKLRQNKHKAGRMDISFFFLVIVLITIGLIMVFSASYATSLNENNNGVTIVIRQVLFVGLGMATMFLVSYIPYHLYQKLYRLIYFVCLGLTIVALFFRDSRGANRWIDFKVFTFQPSEALKFGLIVVCAALIARNYRQMDTFRKGILEFFYFIIPAFLVVAFQRHLSWLMLMVIICGGMMFIAGSKVYYLLLLVPVALVGLVILQLLGFSYVGDRIDAWLDPFSDIQGDTWQIVQSLYAIGSGGLFGVGLGNSTQKFLWLSEPQNDFIFAVVCEELGLVGAIAIILLFVLFVASGFSIAMRAPDKFGSMLVIGVILEFGVQALLNIAVVSNAMPTTGISLPFFSAGGSATLVQLAQIGVVLNVSRYCRPAISRKKDPEDGSGKPEENKPKIKIISSRDI